MTEEVKAPEDKYLMTTEEVKEFQKAISVADWNLNLGKFAELIGADPSHVYTQEKFRHLASLNKALNQFDAETLSTLINGSKRT